LSERPPPEGFRLRLAEAAQSLANFRLAGGIAPPAGTPDSLRPPSDERLRVALEDAAERIRFLDAELLAARQSSLETSSEIRRLADELRDRRAAADEAEARAVPLREKATLLSAECVRLESMRRKAEAEASAAEAAGRALAESLRRDLREVKEALERTVGEASAQEARAKAEIEVLSKRLIAAVSRLQTLEREKRLEAGRVAGDASAVQAELERTQAVVASLRAEMGEARDAAARRESVLRQETVAANSRLEDVRSAFEARGRELEHEHAAAVALRRELDAAQANLQAAEASPPPRASLQSPPLAEDVVSLPDAEEVATGERSPFLQPGLEPMLDPGWSRLLRLVRPPVEAAYAHLRRLSATALTTGQQALLRMAAASITQATDSLASVELSLEEGPPSAVPAGVIPLLDSALTAWESAFRSRGVALVREWPGPLPGASYDVKSLRVLVYHALRNALEAVPAGGRLAVRAARGENGGLKIEFLDDGPGFPRAWLERRFEPFASPRGGRAGLGLAIARRTLRRWGGDAEAENEPSGRGARLTFRFPPPAPTAPPGPF
jgi:signal transduction histidine kinase